MTDRTGESAQTSEDNATQNSEDLGVFVQSLLEQMQSRFTQMSEAIIGRIDEMGSRIDDLEKSIGELMDQTNVDEDVSGKASSALENPASASKN